MPSRKADHIVQILRDEIVSGQRSPGEKLPTYDALMEQFQVTRPTVARVLNALRDEGLVTVRGTRGVFVAQPASAPTTNVEAVKSPIANLSMLFLAHSLRHAA